MVPDVATSDKDAVPDGVGSPQLSVSAKKKGRVMGLPQYALCQTDLWVRFFCVFFHVWVCI